MTRLSKNIVYNLFGYGTIIVLSLITVPFIYKRLGADVLGIIFFTNTLTVVLTGVLNKGIFSTTVREISLYHTSEQEYIVKYIQTWTVLSWGCYLLFAVVIYFLASFLVTRWINLSTISQETAICVLKILCISSITTFVVSFYSSLLKGLQKMGLCNIIDIVVMVLMQGGTLLILYFRGNIFHISYWIAISFGVKILSYLFTCIFFFPIESFIPLFSKSVIKRTYGFTGNMVLLSILNMILKQADKLIVSKLMLISNFGFYGVSYGAISRTGFITTAVSQAAFPAVCSTYKYNDKSQLVAQYKKLQDFISLINAPVFAFINFIEMPLLTYAFNSHVAEMLQIPIFLLTIAFFLNGTIAIPNRLMLAAGKPEIMVRQNTYMIFIMIPLLIGLVKVWELKGASFGWVVYFLLIYAYAIPRIFKECVGISVWTFFEYHLKILFYIIISYGTAYCLALLLSHEDKIIFLVIYYFAASVLFIFISYFGVCHELRNTLNKYQFIRQHFLRKDGLAK